MDRVAESVPSEETASVPQLARSLGIHAKTDRMKARAIFTWVAENISYDVDCLKKGVVSKSPEEILRSRCGVCNGYSKLFKALADACHLESKIVVGSSKCFDPEGLTRSSHDKSLDYGYVEGSHAWNSVKIDGKWRLLDTTWASARKLVGGEAQVSGKTNDYFFLTPPEEMIYSHFPANPDDQLLTKPLSRKEYDRLSPLQPGYFKYHVRLKSKRTFFQKLCDLESQDGSASFEFETGKAIDLNEMIYVNGEIGGKGRTFHQRTETGEEIRILFDKPGDYYVSFIGREHEGASETWDPVVVYKVRVRRGAEPKQDFPVLFRALVESSGYLISPVSGVLEANRSHFFRLKAPNATSVTLEVGSARFPLIKDGDYFSATVKLTRGKPILMAKFSNDTSHEHGLASFKLQ